MERQAAYDLFTCFLEKCQVKGIDPRKDLSGLLAYGEAKGCFLNPHAVHEVGEWRKLGDLLWEAVLGEDKTARKLAKQWKVVINALQQYHAEQKAAKRVTDALEKVGAASPETLSYPTPPATNTILIRAPELPSITPSAPLMSADLSNSSEKEGVGAEPVSGAESKLASEIAKERREVWNHLAREALMAGDRESADALLEVACSMVYNYVGGDVQATINALDWKWLTQLRSIVSEFGIHGEPTRQMLDYLWGTQILLPGDIRSIMRLILTQHQSLLFSSHWQGLCQESVNVQRQPGDPLHGVTLQELMGLENFSQLEAQALLSPDKLREAMQLARAALNRVKAPGGIPTYMGIKQGREEPFSLFIDRVAGAIEQAGVPDYMRGALLKQCALQNSNQATQAVLVALPGTWTIEESLE